MSMPTRLALASFLALCLSPWAWAGRAPGAGGFAENPIVYFVITDRFYNANPANDRSYGREPDGEQEIGTFHGGDLAGLTEKLEAGYFTELGVNGLWITAPYEQIHGWVVGGDEAFRHYAYHGYFALDYTRLDANMGTTDHLRAFIAAAHARDIRVIFDVVMNHPGYGDPWTLSELGVDVVWEGWEEAIALDDYHGWIDYNDFDFTDWWGPDWVRAGLPGYEEGNQYDDKLMQLAYLPDFRTESELEVDIPVFLQNKFDTGMKTIPGFTVRDYLVKWLSDWVRDYGVDGFRADTVKHVEGESWQALKDAAVEALTVWKAENSEQAVDEAPFWMVGEVFPHGVERTEYFDVGFDSLINFDFQERLQNDETLEAIYSAYAAALGASPDLDVLSYISSHDTELYDREDLVRAGTALMLVPGGVQIFYGDETARPPGPAPASDPQQATRSDMNWDSIDTALLDHWRRLGRFRNRHVALARGEHRMLGDSPYTFARVHPHDRVVVAVGAEGTVRLPVDDVFAAGAVLHDAYGGETVMVADNAVVLTNAQGVVLLEAAP